MESVIWFDNFFAVQLFDLEATSHLRVVSIAKVASLCTTSTNDIV